MDVKLPKLRGKAVLKKTPRSRKSFQHAQTVKVQSNLIESYKTSWVHIACCDTHG